MNIPTRDSDMAFLPVRPSLRQIVWYCVYLVAYNKEIFHFLVGTLYQIFCAQLEP